MACEEFAIVVLSCCFVVQRDDGARLVVAAGSEILERLKGLNRLQTSEKP